MRRVSSLLLVLVLVLPVLSWAGDIPLVAGTLVPAAAAKVNYEHDRNGNVKFKIETKHLAPPDQLTPAKNAYVVWVKPTDGPPQNAGVLRINNDPEGSFSCTTPAKAFNLSVTAEDSPSVTQPTGPEILHGSIQAK